MAGLCRRFVKLLRTESHSQAIWKRISLPDILQVIGNGLGLVSRAQFGRFVGPFGADGRVMPCECNDGITDR